MSKLLLDKFLTRSVKHGRLGIVFAEATASTYGTPAPGFPEVVVRFADRSVPRDILSDPRLGAAEAFMDGRLIIEEGDVMDLVTLLRANNAWDKGGDIGKPSMVRRMVNKASFAAEQLNNRVSSQANVAHHYDIGNDLYALMLDEEHWQYSCAYWPDDAMTLDEAQTAKLAHIAAKLAVKPGQHVLDIGCGDGALLQLLEARKNVGGRGIGVARDRVNACVARGLSVIQGDADRDLDDYPDKAFDYAVLSLTIQATRYPKTVLENLLRIGRHAIVSFPNFGHWKIRTSLMLHGRMPQTRNLPEPWYDSPDSHLCSIIDFAELCKAVDAEIEEAAAFNSWGRRLPINRSIGFQNLFGEKAVFLMKKS